MYKGSRIPYLNLIPLLIIGFILYKVINRVDNYLFINTNFISVISPFLWAFAISYLLNPIMNYLETHHRFKRGWSIFVIYLFTIGVITIVITIVTPRIVNSIADLIKDLPTYFEETEKWLRAQINSLKFFDRYGVTSYLEQYLNTIIQEISIYINKLLSTAVLNIINITSFLLKILLALIISVYLLKDKEIFIKSIKRILFAFFNHNSARNIIDFGKELDKVFSQFIIGKFIDSCIIGIICFIGLAIIKAPYAMLLSIIVGITNMIPYFGPFFGGVPAVAITLFHDPIKALWVTVFILILQQFDGWILGPKILGDSVGLSPFWIILAIVLGGGFFGVVGMFLGVPIMAVIKTLLHRFVNRKLQSKDIKI